MNGRDTFVYDRFIFKPDTGSPMPFDPRSLVYNDDGLLPAIAQEAGTLEVLMLAWMSAQSLARTLETGWATYWSRSRRALWVKGETSGHRQRLVDLRFDCDRDSIVVLVHQAGPACHTGRRTCFYTAVRDGETATLCHPVGGAGG